MMNHVVKLSVAVSMLAFSSLSFADIAALKKSEDKILKTYKDSDFFEVNGDIMSDISAIIEDDPDSFKYDFPKLNEAGYVHIKYSNDKKLKFYTFDVSGGGTMGEWENFVQYYTGKNIHLDEFQAGYVNTIKQVNIQQKPVYLVESYYKGDSCHGMHNLRAVEVGPKQLLKAYVFATKTKTLHDLDVEYDCHNFDHENYNESFRIDAKNVDVLLLNENGIPQNKYLRYSLGTKGYTYKGIVK
jgi:hypothetical protein